MCCSGAYTVCTQNSHNASQIVLTVDDQVGVGVQKRETGLFQVKGWARPLEEVEFKLSHEGWMGFDQRQQRRGAF